MSRMLSDLLGTRHSDFSHIIKELERANGFPRSDIRLTAQIIRATQEKIRLLGLDPQDTTGPELYAALHQRLIMDNNRFMASIHLESSSSSLDMLSTVVRFINGLKLPLNCFAMKPTVARKILKQLPPTNTMKLLNYRSLDSMLKRERIDNLYATARMIEPMKWQKQLLRSYRLIKSTDFEHRQIAVNLPNTRRWEEAIKILSRTRRDACVLLPELGSVVVLPITITRPVLPITTTLLIFEAINDLRTASALFKLQQVKPDFGILISRTAEGLPYTIGSIGRHQMLPWRVMQYHYGRYVQDKLPEVFEPHVQPEDLKLIQAETALSERIPALEFWENTDNLALVYNSEAVSLNMLDVALNCVNDLSFSDRVVNYARDHVWRELLDKYLDGQSIEKALSSLGESLSESFLGSTNRLENIKI